MSKKIKNKIRNTVLFIVTLLVVIFVFRGEIYQATVNYKDDGGRKNYKVKDKNLAIFIEDNIPNGQSKSIESLIDLSQELTNKALDLDVEIKENDPNKTVLLKRASKPGYATFTASVGNYLIDKYKLSEVWEARPVKGRIYLLDFDLHKKTGNKNFKDHDFVIFKNKITKKEISVDPRIYGSLRINRISKQAKN